MRFGTTMIRTAKTAVVPTLPGRGAGLLLGKALVGAAPLSATASPLTTLASLVDTNTSTLPHKESLKVDFQDIAWDNTELQTHVDALARGLADIGFSRGSSLALWSRPDAEAVVANLAAAKIGVNLIIIDPEVSVEEVGVILKKESCRGLIASERHGKHVRTEELTGLIPGLERAMWADAVRCKEFRDLKLLVTTGEEAPDGFSRFKDVLHYGSSEALFDDLTAASAPVSDTDALVTFYGAGGAAPTTQTHAAVHAAATKAADSLKLSQQDAVLVSTPLSTPAGVAGLWGAAAANAKVILAKDGDSEAAKYATKTV